MGSDKSGEKEVILMKVTFKKEKVTKNTVKYAEVPEPGKPPVIGTLYVQQWFAGDRNEITIDVPEGK